MTRHLVDDVPELEYGYAHQTVIASEAIVLDADVELEAVGPFLAADQAGERQDVLG